MAKTARCKHGHRLLTVVFGVSSFRMGRAFDLQGVLGPIAGYKSANHATEELDAHTFHSYLKANPVTAILFYAPWCFYSQQIMPTWDIAAQKLQIHDPPVKLAKLDSHRYGSVGHEYGVSAFPTIKLFVDGSTFDYDDNMGRGWQQIVKWVNRHLDRDHVLTSEEDAENFLHDNDLNVIGLFPDGFAHPTFQATSRRYEDVVFAEASGTKMANSVTDHIVRHATFICGTIDVGSSTTHTRQVSLPRDNMECDDAPKNPQRASWTDKFKTAVTGSTVTVERLDHETDGWGQNLQIKCCDKDTGNADKIKISIPSVVMFMPHDERFAVYEGDIHDDEKLNRWIQSRRLPMVSRWTSEFVDQVMEKVTNLPFLFLMIADDDEKKEGLEGYFREAAKSIRGRVVPILAGSSTMVEQRLLDLTGNNRDDLPTLTLIEGHFTPGEGRFHTSRKFRLEVLGASAQKIVSYIDHYQDGSLKPHLKSEPVPTAEDMDGAVGVLVGTTFQQAVKNTKKDVLVNLYAPWCGHCRKFEPQYKELARRLKHVKTLDIFKLDATRNEVDGIDISGFPTILLFKANDNEQAQYAGNRDPADMTSWLKRHCALPFDETPPVGNAQASSDPESGLLDDSEDL